MLGNIISITKSYECLLLGKVKKWCLKKIELLNWFEQLSGLLDSPLEFIEVSLCSLRILEDVDNMVCSMLSTPSPVGERIVALEDLLKNYKEIFNELMRLPPTRGHDHTIPLKERAQPINLRPYKYYEIKKDTMEKMVAEILESRII